MLVVWITAMLSQFDISVKILDFNKKSKKQIVIITTASFTIDREDNNPNVEALIFPNVGDAKDRF